MNAPNAQQLSKTYSGPDIASSMMLRPVEDAVASYKSLNARLEAAEGDKSKAIQSFMSDPATAEAKKIVEQIEKLQDELRKQAEAYANKNVVKLSDEQKEKIKIELKALSDKIKGGRKVVLDSAKLFNQDVEGVTKALDEIGDPTKSRRGSSSAGGSKLPRWSGEFTLTGGKLEKPLNVGSFTELTKWLEAYNVPLEDGVKSVQLAFAQAAEAPQGDNELGYEIKEVAGPVDFTMGDYKIHCVKKERAAYGTKKAAEK